MKKRMKFPNGFGSISELSGNRRRPWAVRKTINGHSVYLGYFSSFEDAIAFSASATTSDSSNMVQQSTAGSAPSQAIGIDASRSSSVYGNSTTVQPPALTMQYAIYTGNVGKYCWLRTV